MSGNVVAATSIVPKVQVAGTLTTGAETPVLTVSSSPEQSLEVGSSSLCNTTSRIVTDGVTNTTTTFTSATAQFSAADVGRTLSATGVPAGATISSVTNPTTVVLSAAATATATGLTTTIGTAATVYVSVSLVPVGGTGGPTNRLLNSYPLAAYTTLDDIPGLDGAMLGPGDSITMLAGTANAIAYTVTGTVAQ